MYQRVVVRRGYMEGPGNRVSLNDTPVDVFAEAS